MISPESKKIFSNAKRNGFLLLFLFFMLSVSAQNETRQRAFALNRDLGRGINFMASKINRNYQSPYDFRLIRKNKFTHVRIGSLMWMESNTGGAPDYTIHPEKLQQYQNAVDWALQQGLMVVIDPIHSWNDFADSDLPRLLQLWKQIALHFAGYPVDSVAFEIINEPRSNVDMKPVIRQCIDTIRSIRGNEKRIIIVSGKGFSTRQALINAFNNNVFPPDDPYLIGTFHYYDPRTFTKQGAAGNVYWAAHGDNDPDWEVTTRAFDAVTQADSSWAIRNHTSPLPVYCGEFGVDNGAPRADRIRWLWWIRTVSEAHRFSNALWNLYNDAPASKGLGPWTSLQRDDPSTRTLDQQVLIPYRNRYEGEKALMSQHVTAEYLKGSSDDSVAVFRDAIAGDRLTLPEVYIPHGGNFQVTFRYQNLSGDTLLCRLGSLTPNRSTDSVCVKIPPTGEKWTAVTLLLHFSTGLHNSLRFTLLSQAQNFLIDYFAVTKEVYYDHLFPAVHVKALVYENPTGVKTFSARREINLYPNPAHRQITLEASRRELEKVHLFNLYGQPLPLMIKNISAGRLTLDIDSLKQGFYLIKTPHMATLFYKTQKKGL